MFGELMIPVKGFKFTGMSPVKGFRFTGVDYCEGFQVYLGRFLLRISILQEQIPVLGFMFTGVKNDKIQLTSIILTIFKHSSTKINPYMALMPFSAIISSGTKFHRYISEK